MDGEITIGTKLDTKQFDAQITELERKVNDIEKMLEDPKKLGLSSRDVQELEVELEKAKNKLISLRQQKDTKFNKKCCKVSVRNIWNKKCIYVFKKSFK